MKVIKDKNSSEQSIFKEDGGKILDHSLRYPLLINERALGTDKQSASVSELQNDLQ